MKYAQLDAKSYAASVANAGETLVTDLGPGGNGELRDVAADRIHIGTVKQPFGTHQASRHIVSQCDADRIMRHVTRASSPACCSIASPCDTRGK